MCVPAHAACLLSLVSAAVHAQLDGTAGTQIVAAHGLSATSLGCFHDSCGGDCEPAPRVMARILGVFPSAKCSGWGQGCAAAPAVACPGKCNGICTASAGESCPSSCDPTQPCSDTAMTPAYCLQQCAALRQRYIASSPSPITH